MGDDKVLNVKLIVSVILLGLLFSVSNFANAQALGSPASKEELRGIDEQIQTLKKEVIQINSELSLLEEKLLFPSSTQTAVFVSMPNKVSFIPDSIELKVDGTVITNHLYIFREVDSLKQGGVQRLIMTNLTVGSHKLEAKLISRAKGGKPKTYVGQFSVNKQTAPIFVELELIEVAGQASINLRNW